MKLCCAVAAAAAVFLFVLGCGGGSETQPEKTRPRDDTSQPAEPTRLVGVTLDSFEGPENVAILMARERGYFADLDLDVRTYTSADVDAPIPYVSERVVELAVSHEPQVVLAKERGAPVVAVGSLLSKPTAAMIWLEGSGIDSIEDLKGKVVGIAGLSFQRKLLRLLLAQAGLTLADVKIQRAGYDLMPRLIHGGVDAILGSANLQGAFLQARGLHPVVVPLQSLGVPAYDELVVIARPDWAAKHRRLVRDFMSAVSRGAAAAAADPVAAAEVSEGGAETDPEVDPEANEAAVEATLPSLSKDGRLNPRRAGALIAWMHREGLIARRPSISALITNRYLSPGA